MVRLLSEFWNTYVKQKPYKLKYCNFYITNVCNLNCTNCNRYNNFAFKGHFKWAEVADSYAKWAEILDVTEFGILGGEPLLHPEFETWVTEIAKLWPDALIGIVTNGTQLEAKRDMLRQLLADYNIKFDVSCHNKYELDDMRKNVIALLDTPYSVEIENDIPTEWWVKSYNDIKADNWPDCPTPDDFSTLPIEIQTECINDHNFSDTLWRKHCLHIYTDGKRTVQFKLADQFSESTIRFNPDTHEFTVYDNDPVDAMAVCSFKHCHMLLGGKMYKCGPVGTVPLFMEQYKVTLTEKQKELIESYVPAEHDWDKVILDAFFANMINADPIPQCSMCPAVNNPEEIVATQKKIKIKQL